MAALYRRLRFGGCGCRCWRNEARFMGKLRKKGGEIKKAMRGEFSPFHQRMLAFHLGQFDFLADHLRQLEAHIAELMTLYAEQLVLLQTIPGVDRLVAWHLLAEMGGDMSVFPDAAHCASWAGLSPGSEESAGVQRSGRTKKGTRYLRRILTQAAGANWHCKDGYLRALFFRIKARRGWAKAIIAVAHKPYRE